METRFTEKKTESLPKCMAFEYFHGPLGQDGCTRPKVEGTKKFD